VAAGLPAPAGLEAHLASCETCREELHVLRQALAMADAEMAGLLIAEPTPELAVRIRQAVAETRERSPHLPARIRQVVAESALRPAWRLGWLWPATAAAATLLVALAVALGRGALSAPESRVAVDAHRSQPTGGTGASRPSGAPTLPSADRPVPASDPNGHVTPRSSGQAESRGVVRSRGRSLRTRHTGVPRDDRTPKPEVVVPPGETEALLRFAAQLQRRAVTPDSLLVADLSAPLAEPRAVDIAPLVIIPLDPTETSGTD
jgi:anti-sigma factor RsiW